MAENARFLMSDAPTNLRIVKPSRKKPQEGDIFAMKLPDSSYLFGRVIRADIPEEQAPMPGAYLVYIYRTRSDSKDPGMIVLNRDNLLLPPVFINRMPWTKGYFETIAKRELRTDDLLRQHCFWRWTGEYLDQRGNKLTGPVEPCGDWGLSSYRWLDDQISDALGIPRVSED